MTVAIPSVSFVVPAHNAAATLQETLDSVLAQTRADWEVVVVDDGSSDSTRAIAHAAAAAEPRLRVLSQAQGGASAARNAGILAARGEFLVLLDSDDWIAPEFLARMVPALQARPDVAAAFCGCQRVLPNGDRFDEPHDTRLETGPVAVLRHHCAVAIHAVLLRRQALDGVGLLDPSLTSCEDWDLWLRLARAGGQFLRVPGTMAFYRMRAGSLNSDPAQLSCDAIECIRRGARPDPRLRAPDPRYLTGDPIATEQAIGHALLWTLGMAAGSGRDVASALPQGIALPDLARDLQAASGALYYGLLIGAQVTPRQLATTHPRYAAGLRDILELVEAASAQPGLGQRMHEAVALRILHLAQGGLPVTIGPVHGRGLNLGAIGPVAAMPGVETLLLQIPHPSGWPRSVVLPMLGDLTPADVLDAVLQPAGLPASGRELLRILRGSGLGRRGRFLLALGRRAPLLARRLAGVARRRLPARRQRLTRLTLATLRAALLEACAGEARGSGPAAVAGILATARASAAAAPVAATPAAAVAAAAEQARLNPLRDRREHWEGIFADPDPWKYGSPYEQLKYERTLALLPQRPIGRALELACAEGMFTTMLAPRVRELLATDISARALDRARQRCAGQPGIAFRQLDFLDDGLPEGLDLLVCSEVLYYLEDRALLRRVAAKFRDALAPGGHLLMAHAHVLADDRAVTGFDWPNQFGAQTIGEAFAATAGLSHERSLRTEVYRIDLFRRLAPGEAPAAAPQVETVPLGSPMEPEVEALLIRGGAVALRAEVRRREATRSVPVLMYHRVASEGPEALARWRVTPEAFEAQMRLLRRHGYHAISSAWLQRHMQTGEGLPGRPVLITFDDGYTDFRDHAWPILRRHDFRPEVFLPTGKVGQSADWNAAEGPPAPLLGWEDILELQRQGVRFGSHMVSHSPSDALPFPALLAEAAESRAVLETRLGAEVTALAYPFGAMDPRCRWALAQAGYGIAYTTDDRLASLNGDSLAVPRIEVRGDLDLAGFAARLGLPAEAPP